MYYLYYLYQYWYQVSYICHATTDDNTWAFFSEPKKLDE